MNRSEQLLALATDTIWDIIVIGGGATGLGTALDASLRDYKTLLIESHDFAKGTSSRSTKLVHGGVRYLQQGNIKLVREALRERGYLLKNAPHLTSVQTFIVPVFSWWEKIFFGIGLKVYDLLSGKLSLGDTQILSKKETLAHLPSINSNKLVGGILYFDGQFDDSHLAIELAATAIKKGATVINYFKATGFIKTNEKITAVECLDILSEKKYILKTKVVVNATGVFTNAIVKMDNQFEHDLVSPSQGIHLVIDAKFFPGRDAMMIPKTDDGRVLFAVPWHDKVVLGTTDTPIVEISFEPKPLEEEIEFIIKHINRYCTTLITRSDINAVYVGLRPLVKQKTHISSALISREHHLSVSPSGLITITGGKWTTYRKMAADAVDNAAFIGKLNKEKCKTAYTQIGDELEKENRFQEILKEDASLAEKIHSNYSFTKAQIVYALKYEMAICLEDILSRRIRLLFLDAKLAIKLAPMVASIMASYLQKDKNWEAAEVAKFTQLAEQYILK
ncbi:MAG: glycerol-3-phosphate dehydrogenase/oxidase [Chitinophagia bacterium]|jgi:glycerol-3-phosphate dehydrogenase|nr:glycerol-3-phosphate dehydrogenase/oxidase [Chitinophagia bacterium]NCA29641.1 glycerol-3-phosphate dehydrogenase/oxidase [Chitinophagia bacterium]NDD15441.1 glycerol-3-phosphate dehydrogenase/oxidase [Chitinophagia bacterium]